MNSEFKEKLFNELPVVAILRFFRKDEVEKLVPASLEGGLRNLEVTMNTPGAAELIRLTCKLVGNQGNVGAGTVTTLEELEQALAAGASFIVTPAVLPDVIQACVKRKVPVMPGAMTPTEVLTAWRLGAKIVKIFPADQLGPGHLKALKAPFPQIPLMPTGGVTVETLPEFKKAGADAFGVGGSMFDPKQVAAGNWEFFREQAARFVRAYTGSAGILPAGR
jgi:2-dehydro-3-deoxyphosphogluconate aldolase/(4S)-4-hydroxy-2-oxoglutarate aldolase